MKFFISNLLLLLTTIIASVYSQCIPSVTTVSGTHAPGGVICSGQLLFEDDFNSFDLNKWSHEITIGGGGVCRKFLFIIKIHTFNCMLLIIIIFFK